MKCSFVPPFQNNRGWGLFGNAAGKLDMYHNLQDGTYLQQRCANTGTCACLLNTVCMLINKFQFTHVLLNHSWTFWKWNKKEFSSLCTLSMLVDTRYHITALAQILNVDYQLHFMYLAISVISGNQAAVVSEEQVHISINSPLELLTNVSHCNNSWEISYLIMNNICDDSASLFYS